MHADQTAVSTPAANSLIEPSLSLAGFRLRLPPMARLVDLTRGARVKRILPDRVATVATSRGMARP